MDSLSFGQIQRLIARAPNPPLNMHPTSDYAEIFSCPICLEYRHGLFLSHMNCGNLICAPCVIQLLQENHDCPVCRDKLRMDRDNPSSSILFSLPTRAETRFLELVDFECNGCGTSHKYREATVHHQSCQGQQRHQPPAHIPQRGSVAFERIELISNADRHLPEGNSRRLVVAHFNGKQLNTKFYRANHSAIEIKQTMANISEEPIDTIKIFKFSHKEIWDNELISNVANNAGATYICGFSNQDALAERSANLLFEEIGAPHIVPPVVTTTNRQESWDDDFSSPGWSLFPGRRAV